MSADGVANPESDPGADVATDGGTDRAADRGSVTAELAAALPAIVLLLLAALTGVAAVGVQLRCVDAAAQAAGTAARGGDGTDAGRRSAPPGAVVAVERAGDAVRASVRAPIHPFGRHLPGFSVGATAVAMQEPGEAGPATVGDEPADDLPDGAP